ncbi:Chitinase 2, variant 2 [Stylosanthes scabra]|uniref:Chalcone-flavonone isomerase family protein n=1 Tax=Stylosanthes scabra TaxID=79078 RepID=A0ABU6V7Q3_9FABA|nr:Chitinase 2, variant 2 [Stylosanthes scabra]
MALRSSLTAVQVDNVTFPPTAKPPASDKTFFLAGAGVRGLQIDDKFVKFTAIAIYLQDNAVPSLSVKWSGKTPQELTESDDFFRDIVTGPFEKFMQVTMILPLTGQQYSEKVSENCVAIWKHLGIYTDREATAIDKFVSVFRDQNFPPHSSILFTVLPQGSLVVCL